MKTTQRMKLDTVWDRCIAMARWVAKWSECMGLSVNVLKQMWLEANGYEDNDLDSNCFFCDFAERHMPDNAIRSCPYCPGRAVDKRFSCVNVKYHHRDKPHAFLAKLENLNAKRKK